MKNENLNQTKEDMIKKCKLIDKIIAGILWAFVGIAVVYIILGLIFTGGLIILPDAEQKAEFGNQFFYVTDNIGAKVEQIGEQIGEKVENFRNNEVMQTVAAILSWFILISISKMLKNTINKETPFTGENVNYMKKISIAATILWITQQSFGLIYVFTIWIISFIFKYGYQLQLESDETL